MGLHADRALGFVYSIGDDGKFRLTDVTSHSVVTDIQPHSSSGVGLKHMIYSESRAVFIMGDGDGWIYMYSQNSHPPEQVCKIQTAAKACIRGLCMNGGGQYLVSGAVDGTLSIFEMGRPKGERFTKQITAF